MSFCDHCEGQRFDRARILKQIEGREISAHALMHAHVDHFGASHAICTRRSLPMWCGEADRVLICGDVMWGWNPFLLRGPIREPFGIVTPDVERNRESARRIAALEPALVCFGHGPVLRDPAKLVAAVGKLAR